MQFKIIKPSKKNIEKMNQNWKWKSDKKECALCHSIFSYGNSKAKFCDLCKLSIKCDLCGEWFEYIFSHSGRGFYMDKELKEKIIAGEVEDTSLYCSKCHSKSNPGLCSNCGKKNISRDGANRGKDCGCCQEWYSWHNSSDKMKEVSAKNANQYLVPLREKWANKGGECAICGKINRKLDQCGRGLTDCECSKQAHMEIALKAAKTSSQLGICMRCGNDTRIYSGDENKNRTVAGICMRCQSKIALKASKEIKKQMELGERDNWPGSCGLPNFIAENAHCSKHAECELQYCDRDLNRYICWECYKKKFITNKDKMLNFMDNVQCEYPNAFLQPTFRTQHSLNWRDASAAFKQDLMDKRIKWFSYIKFYIHSDDSIKPLVVGKTGTKLVNYMGTDVNFSEDVNYGPSRRFLKESSLTWDKTQILVIPANAERDAFDTEKSIATNYHLFQS